MTGGYRPWSKFNAHSWSLLNAHRQRQITGRPGWYEYKEKMLRGHVRMQAEANQVALTGEQALPKQVMHVGNSRTGAYGPTIPKGVNLKGFGKS